MTNCTFIIRSIRFHWRTHLSLLAGSALTTSLLVGALLVGDSTRATLKNVAMSGIGRTVFALDSRDRFFRSGLADRLQTDDTFTVPALRLNGMAINMNTSHGKAIQANRIQIIGIDSRFWDLTEQAGDHDTDLFRRAINADTASINNKLSRRLDISEGQQLSLRIERPSLFSRDAPLSSRKDDLYSKALLSVGAILPQDLLGNFNLSKSQTAPLNVFVDLKWLQETVDLEGQANLMLTATQGSSPMNIDEFTASFEEVWRLEDFGFSLSTEKADDIALLESRQIILPPILETATTPLPHAGALHYLVNSISNDDNSRRTPYSFVTAIAPSATASMSPIPKDMKDNEIIISEWLAKQLRLKRGDSLEMTYYALTPANTFEEKAQSFTVHSTVTMSSLQKERQLAPSFPGLTDVSQCSDWDIGIPMDEAELKDEENESYWDLYEDTPKALVTLNAGQAMWGNRFGALTSIRFPGDTETAELVRKTLTSTLSPAKLGFAFVPVREEALAAAKGSVDLGQLFIGMSFFLLASSLVITAMLFSFNINERSVETGTLLAVGLTRRHVRALLLAEAGTIALLGAGVGSALGTYYTRALLWGLQNLWQSAVAGTVITFHSSTPTIATGAAASFICSILAILLATRNQFTLSAARLISGAVRFRPRIQSVTKNRIITTISLLFLVGAIIAVVSSTKTSNEHAVSIFFTAGTLLLLAGMGFARSFLTSTDMLNTGMHSTVQLALRNAGRRPGRSIATISSIACGCFLVFAVSSMKEDITAHADKRSSGTGGFELFGRSSLPIHSDMNTTDGRMDFRIRSGDLPDGVTILPMKLYDADDASCLNLNRITTPPVIGVNASQLSDLKAFLQDKSDSNPWTLLNQDLDDGTIPAIVGDMDTAMWGLRKKVDATAGDILTYRGEDGTPLRIRLVGALPMHLSVFQGSILMSNKNFARSFPSVSGNQIFMVDTPNDTAQAVKQLLNARMEKAGIDFQPSTERLQEFYSVQSGYMSMFLALGGLGLLLGSIGMGIIVLRNVLERRSELATLRALGFSRLKVKHVVILEHFILLAIGMAIGTSASLIAIWPNIHAPLGVALQTIALFLAGIAVLGTLWIWGTATLSLRGNLTSALRNE